MLRDENRRLRAQLEASQRNVDDLNEVCGSQTALVNVAEARAKELQEQLEAQERMLTDVRRALSLDDMSRNDHEAGLTSEETLAFIREAVSSPATERQS